MVRPTTPIAVASRIPSADGSSYGFNSAVKAQKGYSAYRHTKSSADKLGYVGVVERCDSQEFPEPQQISSPEKASSPQKQGQSLHTKTFEIPNEMPRTPSWKAMPARSPYAQRQRPSSAHVDTRHRDSRQNPFQSGRSPLQANRVNLDFNNAGSPSSRPQSGNPANRGHAQSQSQHYSFKAATDKRMQDQRQANSQWKEAQNIGRTSTTQRIEENVELATEPEKGDSDLERQLHAQTAQINALNTMLKEQQHEKMQMAQQNIALQQQVERLGGSERGHSANSRQRPWSACSAGSAASGRSRGHQPVAQGFKIPGQMPVQQGAAHQRMMSAYGRQDPYAVGGSSRKPSARPASGYEPRQMNQGRLVQTGYNMRGKPMFGFASLEHREVYSPFPDCDPPPPGDMVVPTGPMDKEVQHSPSQVGKDEVFDRANAQRQLAMKSRPQSASAAQHRTQSNRPVSAAQRPGSARPTSSYAERLMHQDADEFVGFHRAVPKPGDAGRWVDDVLAAMRRRAANKYIRVVDFMVSFDRMRRGSMTCSEFRRALEACGCFGDMPESDYVIVMEPFLDIPGQRAPAHRINYAAFCEVLQPVGDRRVKLNEQQRHLMTLGRVKPESVHSPLQANNLSREGEVKLKGMIMRITEQITAARVPVRDLMEAFDPRSFNVNKSSTISPQLNKGTGCISRSQFLRGIRSFRPGFNFSDEELALLFCKYERGGEFNYFLFCRDLEGAEGLRN